MQKCNLRSSNTGIIISLLARFYFRRNYANTNMLRTSGTNEDSRLHCGWTLVRQNGKNRRYVNLSAIAISIGSTVCQALSAYHAFTGTEYMSAIIRKGNVRPFRRLESSNDAQDALIAITSGKVDASSERALLKFGATLFGAKAAESSSLNGFRYTAFEKACGPSANAKNPLHKLKGVDASSLPPCEDPIQQNDASNYSVKQLVKH